MKRFSANIRVSGLPADADNQNTAVAGSQNSPSPETRKGYESAPA